MYRKVVVSVITYYLVFACCCVAPSQDRLASELLNADDEQREQAAGELKKVCSEAEVYVANMFQNADIVLLGETHQIKENCRFVADLLPVIYDRAKVRRLVWEFAPSRLNEELRELVTAPKFDRARAINVLRQNAWPTWGFEDYLGILEAAWKINHERNVGDQPFLVVGMDTDWRQSTYLDQSKVEQFNTRLKRESHMADVIRSEVLDRKLKALVQVGRDHTFNQGVRLGAVLKKELKDRVRQVCLHFKYPSRKGPAAIELLIEDLMSRVKKRGVGFDIKATPLADLRDPTCFYWSMAREATLADLIDGYIFLVPLKEQHRMTWIEGFVQPSNYQEARQIALRFKMIDSDTVTSPVELDRALALFFSGLK